MPHPVHVNAANRPDNPDGRSWATAFRDLQDALALGPVEIWVAAGTYVPGNVRDATFQLHPGQALYGGFLGCETQRSARDAATHRTVLDGDSVHHVVTGADGAVLDGFTICGGRGETRHEGAAGTSDFAAIRLTPETILAGSNTDAGGGMINFQAAPVVRNCVFEANTAGKGGAVYNAGRSSNGAESTAKAPLFVDCIFRNNAATARGGGVSNDLGVNPVFLNCVFEDNATDGKGGGMYNHFACSPLLFNCLFTANRARSAGGLGNDGGSSPVLFNCTFTHNSATDFGAPLYLGTGPANDPTLIDCVIADNHCDWEESGLYVWHDNRPRILTRASADHAGYRPGRWREEDIAGLRNEIAPYVPGLTAEPEARAEQQIVNSPRLVYVDAAAGAEGDGQSWASAYTALETALVDAGADGAEVRIAGGTYRLGLDRSSAFVLQPGVRLYGGYKGKVRDPANNPSVLDGNGAYHVVIGADGALLDGFTITGGRADGDGYDGKGGGLINYHNARQAAPFAKVISGRSTKVRNCIFSGNSATDGGAVYSYDRAAPVFEDCLFIGNSANNGGAVLDRVGVTSVFRNCTFEDNSARWRGGALYLDYGVRATLTGCTFRGNASSGHGGAVFAVSRASQLEYTEARFDTCRFEANAAAGDGGAIAATDNARIELKACDFAGNTAGRQGADTSADETSTLSSE
ncbi:MAG: right-handed parallel beta-helix repeat-containing protein [Methylovirgula sp.]|nr:right-handed parallel beta-helix repeat-containing protein [Methylovirgula sp.]